MYGNASIAEEVCQLNRWDNCSLPINALETALELRQLDTLAFFLRSRETGKKSEIIEMISFSIAICIETNEDCLQRIFVYF